MSMVMLLFIQPNTHLLITNPTPSSITLPFFCRDCCENKCSNKSNSDDQLDSCKEDCIHEADCSEASSDGGSCDDKIDECCDCLDYGCDVESGDSPSKVRSTSTLLRHIFMVHACAQFLTNSSDSYTLTTPFFSPFLCYESVFFTE